MSRWIDYDAIDYRNDRLHDKSEEFLNGVIYMAQRIEEAPSIDIVRCKECKHQERCEQMVLFENGKYITSGYKLDYCSYGERETDHE